MEQAERAGFAQVEERCSGSPPFVAIPVNDVDRTAGPLGLRLAPRHPVGNRIGTGASDRSATLAPRR